MRHEGCMIFRSFAALVFTALSVAACAAPAARPRLAAPMTAPPPPLRLFGEAEGERRPAVLLVPGCEAPLIGARAAMFPRYAAQLAEAGFVVGVLAYPGAAEAEPACPSDAAIVAAIAAGAERLRQAPGAAPDRLHIVGWARGGRAVLRLVARPEPLAGLVSAAAIYPPCPPPAPWRSTTTLHLFLGEHDRAAPPEACRVWAEASEGPAPTAITRYVGVGHGFDVEEAGDAAFASYQRDAAPLRFDASTGWQLGLDLTRFLKLDLKGGGKS